MIRVLQGAPPTLAARCRLLLCCVFLGLAHRAGAASPPATESDRFMVVSAQHLAAEAGAEILRDGGNAIDAAVAIGYAEAVTNPVMRNGKIRTKNILRLGDERKHPLMENTKSEA